MPDMQPIIWPTEDEQRSTVALNSELPVNRESVEWAYRLILDRPPESEESINSHLGLANVADLRARFMNSPEFTESIKTEKDKVPKHLLSLFPPWVGDAESDSFRDFLGVRTRCAYLPSAYSILAGTVQGHPGTEPARIHDLAEWTALLSSAVEAKGSFVGVELGAGWGPWVVAGAKAAERLGISNIRLAAVEAA